MNRAFLLWWLIVLLMGVSLWKLIEFGVLQNAIETDTSYCVIAILSVFGMSTLGQGWFLYRTHDNMPSIGRSIQIVEALGFLGTICGMLMVFNAANSGNLKESIIQNMSVAFITTFAGLVASILLRCQKTFRKGARVQTLAE